MQTACNNISSSVRSGRQRGSVLVVVMWILFGLIAIAIYFAESMTYEVRASDNRTAGEEAEEVIEGARRYLTCVLSNLNQPGVIPDPQSYLKEGVVVGNGRFWLIGRTNVENLNLKTPTFGLIDEASKLNLNSSFVTTNLAVLPRMTLDLANNIMTWRTTNTGITIGGADSTTYMSMQPPYLCKSAPFETMDELRLVYNMNLDLLYGEDANLNGIADSNENDGDVLPPSDNMDGRLNPGLFEYLTIYTHEPTTQTNGQARVNLTTAATLATQLGTLLTGLFGDARASQIMLQAGIQPAGGQQGQGGFPTGGVNVTFTSPLQFYMVGGMTPAEFNQVEGSVMGANTKGLINVNTASSMVLSCLPGMDISKAEQLVNFRQSNQNNQDYRNSVCWVAQILDPATCLAVGPYITGRTYQFTADIVALGHNDRGYRRTRFVIDTASGTPIVVYRQDLTHLGWALGKLDSKPNSLFTAK